MIKIIKNSLKDKTLGMFSEEWYDSTALFIDDKITLKKEGYVYIIKSILTGEVKIGKTSSPQKRLNEIRSYIGDILVIGIIPYDESEDIEKNLHMLFKRNRVRGEWFEGLDIEDIIKCIDNNKGWYINEKFINSKNILDLTSLNNNRMDMTTLIPSDIIDFLDSINIKQKGKYDKSILYNKSDMKEKYSQRKMSSFIRGYLDFYGITYYEKKSGNVRYFDVIK